MTDQEQVCGSSTLLSNVRTLSDGTLATLTGIKDKNRIEEVRAHFLSFTRAQITAGVLSSESRRWQDAWGLYVQQFEF
jgi:hypothetical protein